jgi:hypothetical protein
MEGIFMGTRNLTVVKINNEIKIAQYGQWDGYPSGQGITVLSFLQNKELIEKLKNNLKKCKFVTETDQFVIDYNKNVGFKEDHRTPEQKEWFKKYIHRDIAADILENVAKSQDDTILLSNSIEYEKDCGCEWEYKIDFDENVLIVFDHRKEVKQYSLSKLPAKDQFLKDLESSDDD